MVGFTSDETRKLYEDFHGVGKFTDSAALAAGTPVHFICYEFKGRELVRLEEVDLLRA